MKNPIANLNKAFESKVRLGIMSALVVNANMDFNALKTLLDVTDGNLASHLKALEKEEYISVTKQFVGRKPNTKYEATSVGRNAFKAHIDALEKLISGTQ